jgi:hypothetical protein
MPAELHWARIVVAMAERFGVLPSAVLAEPSSTLRMLELLDPDCGKAD